MQGTVPPGPVDTFQKRVGDTVGGCGRSTVSFLWTQVCPPELSFSGGVPSASVRAKAWLGSCPVLPLKGVFSAQGDLVETLGNEISFPGLTRLVSRCIFRPAPECWRGHTGHAFHRKGSTVRRPEGCSLVIGAPRCPQPGESGLGGSLCKWE